MKKLLAAATLALAAMTAPALAQSTMDAAFANTITTTVNGATTKWMFNADGTFTGKTPEDSDFAGTWTRTGETLCVTPTGGEQACAAVVDGKKVGDTWTTTGADGTSLTVALVAGR